MIEIFWVYYSYGNNVVYFFKERILLNKYLSANTVILEMVHCYYSYPHSTKLWLIQPSLL